MKILVQGIFLFLGIVILTPIQAKWIPLEDAPTKNSYNDVVNINSDGTYDITEEMTREILTEEGRDLTYTNIILNYNDDSEKIKILEAKTIYQGKEYKVNRKHIEDKPLASEYDGFDQKRQVLIVFPQTEIGAKLYLKHKLIQKKPRLENFYAELFSFGLWEFVTDTNVKINSKLPLHFLVNDPENSLTITENKNESAYSLKISSTKPIYKDIINEPSQPIDDKYFTWVSISSIDNWRDFAAKYGKLLPKVPAKKLPPTFGAILNAAQQKESEIDQINTVTSLLNEKIRYMGDWRSVNGRYIPHTLNEINRTQIGDCKDFATATIAILTKLGYKAQLAVVMRGVSSLSPRGLPNFSAFNHAIAKVTGKQGKVYWIDPTNFESMANGIFPDIAGKMAVILDPKDPGYEKIPTIDPTRAKEYLKRQLTVMDNKIVENGNLLIKNEATLGLTENMTGISNDMMKNSFFYILSGMDLDETDKKSMRLPKLNSRIVKDLSLEYSCERKNDILQTNVGPALELTTEWPVIKFFNISQDHVSAVLISNNPCTIEKQTVIKNIIVKNIESLNKEMKTPWLYIKRKCDLNHNNDLQIDDTLIIYKNLIPSEDFKKPEFIKFKNWLKTNFDDVIVVFELKPEKN